MTRREASYALDIICKELSGEDKARLSSEINRLFENLPTITEAPKTFLEEYDTMSKRELLDLGFPTLPIAQQDRFIIKIPQSKSNLFAKRNFRGSTP